MTTLSKTESIAQFDQTLAELLVKIEALGIAMGQSGKADPAAGAIIVILANQVRAGSPTNRHTGHLVDILMQSILAVAAANINKWEPCQLDGRSNEYWIAINAARVCGSWSRGFGFMNRNRETMISFECPWEGDEYKEFLEYEMQLLNEALSAADAITAHYTGARSLMPA